MQRILPILPTKQSEGVAQPSEMMILRHPLFTVGE